MSLATTLATDLAAVLAESLRMLGALGMAATTTLTPAGGGSAATADALDATDLAGGFDPSGAGVTAPASEFVTVRRRRLFVAPQTTTGAPLPFVPQPGDTATWEGRTGGVLGVTPIQPGATPLGYYVDLEH